MRHTETDPAYEQEARTRPAYEPEARTRTGGPNLRSEPADKLGEVLVPMLRSHDADWAAVARTARNYLGLPGDDDTMRSLTTNVSIGELVAATYNAAILEGFSAEPDNTLDWTFELPAENYLESQVFGLAKAGRLGVVPKGGKAPEGKHSLTRSTCQIARFAKLLTIDEKDFIDGRSVGLSMFQARQLGAECRRLRPDAVFSMILNNPAMTYDSTELFHGDHSNLGTAAFGGASLNTALAAIGNQVLTGDDGKPVHINNAGRILVVPPDLAGSARTMARAMSLGDDRDIEVRSESRLGTAGVVTPLTQAVETGSSINWLLAAPAAAVPSIVVAVLDGDYTPTIEHGVLEHGRWGFFWSVRLAIAVVACSHHGVYWSSGDA